jgi:hypothetical protein
MHMTIEENIAILKASLDANTVAVTRLAELLDLSKALDGLVTAEGVVADNNAPSLSPANPLVSSPQGDEAVNLPEATPPAAMTFEQCKVIVTNVLNNKGRELVIPVFKEFGISKLPEATVDQYPLIAAALEAL